MTMQINNPMGPEEAIMFDTWTYLECWYINDWKKYDFFDQL